MAENSNLINEYTALREEVLKRIELRHNTVTFMLSIAGAMLGFSLQTRQIALLYPVVAFSFCCIWAQNEMRELQLCDYLHRIEKELSMGWSDYYKSIQAQGSFFKGIPISVIAPGWIFVLTSMIAVGLARNILFTSFLRTSISMIDLLSILAMIYFILRIRANRLLRRSCIYHIYKEHIKR